jgi:hypothetical protein
MTPQVAAGIEHSISSGTAFGGRQGQDDWMRRCSRKSKVFVADHNQEDFPCHVGCPRIRNATVLAMAAHSDAETNEGGLQSGGR